MHFCNIYRFIAPRLHFMDAIHYHSMVAIDSQCHKCQKCWLAPPELRAVSISIYLKQQTSACFHSKLHREYFKYVRYAAKQHFTHVHSIWCVINISTKIELCVTQLTIDVRMACVIAIYLQPNNSETLDWLCGVILNCNT